MNRVFDLVTIGLWAVAVSIILFSIPGLQGLWAGTALVVILHLLLALVLFRQDQIPFRYQLPFLFILSLVIGFSCVAPFAQEAASIRYFFALIGSGPQILLLFPGSIITMFVITLTAWGSLQTLLATKRPEMLRQLSWAVPVFYTTVLALFDAWLVWPVIKYWFNLS
jgi:hypothetical protein